MNRKLSSLKSLFNYLQNKAEDNERRPLLQRNVMAKIDLNQVSQDIETRAAIIEHKILSTAEQIEDFRNFVASGFAKVPNLLNKQLSWYEDNRERDLAIVSLILSSGLRVSEFISLTIDAIDWEKRRILIKRKGNKELSLPFSERAKLDLRELFRGSSIKI
ncbi:tyrosine-type recombinase/integrase [Paenibacillus aestuarii]|uniref:Tyrosine-type recombinase/integrase n=1 Tax=Paenibacillus aestuarii TaxID=516965 RepID=A0ABW0K7Q0_9BACL|nr:tyrosine-type recombinase/integrase [Paenibacillus aestuarii]